MISDKDLGFYVYLPNSFNKLQRHHRFTLSCRWW